MVLISLSLAACEWRIMITGNTVAVMQDACYALGADVDHFDAQLAGTTGHIVTCTNGKELSVKEAHEVLKKQEPIGEPINPREIP